MSAMPSTTRLGTPRQRSGAPDAAAAPTTPPGADRRRSAMSAAVLGLALLLGAATDWLLAPGPIGAGFTLAALALLGVTGAFGARVGRVGPEAGALLGIGAAFACLLSWRASPALAALNLLSLGVALALLAAVMVGRGRRGVRHAWFRDYGAALACAAGAAVGGAAVAGIDAARWRSARGGRSRVDPALAVRAVLVTAPLLLLFGALLTAADPVFERIVGDVFRVDASDSIQRVLATLGFAWPAAGFLYLALLDRTGAARLPRIGGWRARGAGVPEVMVALGALDVLFLAFVVVQLRYLFGGGGAMGVVGLTHAEYARRGFFELVWVTALVLPVLLIARNVVGRAAPRVQRRYRMLGGAMLVLVLMIVASAMYRMRMYQAEYGLTELRLYASAFMGWIVGVLGLCALTVLQGRRRGLAFGALSSGWAAVFALNVANPDALIVRTNAARLDAGREFDAAYASRLSDDAAPALAGAFPRLTANARCITAARLAQPAGTAGWRHWKLTQWRAAPATRRAFRAVAATAACRSILQPPIGDPAQRR